MRIAIVFEAIAVLMLIGLAWMSIRDGKPKLDRLYLVTAMLGLIGLAQLTQDVVLPLVFDVPHSVPFVGAAIAVWAIVAPVFRVPEDDGGETKSLLER